MNRPIAITCTLILLAAQLRGQEVVRFDTVYQSQVGSFAIGYSVFEVDSGYRVFSIQKGLADQSQDIFVEDFNAEGGWSSQRTFETYQQDWMGSRSPVQQDDTTLFVGVTRGAVITVLDSLFLYKFDGEGDTAWTRFIAVDTALAMRGTAITAAGDVLLAGIHYPGWSDGGNEAFVFRLDSAGATKSYHGYPGLDGEDVVEGRDRHWYVCGVGNSTEFLNRPVLLRSDTLGSVDWTRTLPQYGTYWSLITLMDHGIVALGSHRLPQDTSGYSLAIKYDTSGSEIWQRKVLPSGEDRPSRFHAGFEAGDSSLIMCGWIQRLDVLTKGTLVKLDKNGEVVWTRMYSHFDVQNMSPWQLFWDVKPTSDGGLVLTGEANSEEYPYGQLWLLKLDSMGCLVPGCESVGVEEFTTDLLAHLRVSPNPARDLVSISLDLPEGGEDQGRAQVHVLDASGRLVQEQQVEQTFNALRATLDISKLSGGTYYLHLRDAKRWLAGSKVVVQ